MLAPIVLFVYNRPEHTLQTLTTLKRNNGASKSELFIFSDAPKDENAVAGVNEVRKLIRDIDGFKNISIIERDHNFGLAKSVITGVSEIIDIYGRVIVMEDDLISSPYFLHFMNSALEYYEHVPRVFSITGFNNPPDMVKIPKDYPYDVFFSYRNSSWSWGTWKDRWEKADWEVEDYEEFLNDKKRRKAFLRGGDDLIDILKSQMEDKIDSWWIRWEYTHFKHDAVSVYPVKSYINNIGLDGSGTHCDPRDDMFSDLVLANGEENFPSEVEVNKEIMDAYRDMLKYTAANKLKSLVKKIIMYDELKAGVQAMKVKVLAR